MKLDLKSTMVGVIIGSVGLTTVYGSEKLKSIDVSYGISNVNVQDTRVEFPEGNEPFIYNDTAYVPIRTIAEALDSGVIFNQKDSSIDIYNTDKTKIRLLKEVIAELGASSPEKAIEVWSKGLKDRSAALQYSVMTKSLKETYLEDLNENEYDYWITGVSSPWVEDYEILNSKEAADGSYEYEIKYHTKTSDGSSYFYVTLTLVKEGDYWKISNVNGDEGSGAYTGFTE